MKILALIPARGGSKRLPGKNIRLLGGKPLITWSIDVAKDIPEICDILVSTDDLNIANTASQAGAYVPWLRSLDLATDKSNSIDVTLHALNWYENVHGPVDGILLLQPTSPFRSRSTLIKGINLFIESNYKSIIGVSASPSHSMWTMTINNGYLVPLSNKDGIGLRSQDLPAEFIINGSFYLSTPGNLRDFRSFANTQTIPLIIETPHEAVDIDTDWDWFIATSIINNFDYNE